MQMQIETSSALVVNPTDSGTLVEIKPKSDITVIHKKEARVEIEERMTAISDLLLGNFEDPSIKKCSKCAKENRLAYHPLSSFSMIKSSGKLCSQCKRCKAEQANQWCALRAEHRKKYHAEYRLIKEGEAALHELNGTTPEVKEKQVRTKKNLESLWVGSETD